MIEHGLTSPQKGTNTVQVIRATGLQARTTLNNSSIFDIITVVVFALSPFLYSRDNDAVQKLNEVTSSRL